MNHVIKDMKFLLKTFLLLLLIIDVKAQCPPSNPTTIISGLYSSNINPSPGSVVYVSPTGTITGNIDLINASLYNCGTILSSKITMQQSLYNNEYVLENNNIIKCDTILLDSLGHLHNNDTLICGFLRLNYNTNLDNNYFIDANSILIEKTSRLNSSGKIKSNYLHIVNTYSRFLNYYGNISVRKLFHIDTGAVVTGIIFVCVDSCFKNDGVIYNYNAPSWSPSLRVNGISINTGTINTVDFCDLSSTNGGMPDSNSGILNNITYCTSQQFYCDFNFTSIRENHEALKTLLVFPNPASDIINISINNYELDNSEIEILNSLGQSVLKQSFSSIVSVSSLTIGYYTLIIHTSFGQIQSKFIKN